MTEVYETGGPRIIESQRKIWIFDTTLRDGEQSPGASLNAEEKMEIAKQLARLNVDVIEAGNPISSLEDFEAVEAIAQEIKGPTICALARCVPGDIERAGEAVKRAEKPMIHVYIGVSEEHMQGQLRKTREQVMEMAVASVQQASSMCWDVEFSPMDSGRAAAMEGPQFVYEIIEATIDAGATVINIPDTVGYAVPEQFAQLISDIRKNVSNMNEARLSVHCHNDLDMATANSLVAVKAGASQVECTIGGISERAGGAPLEAIVMALETRFDYFNGCTNIKTKLIVPTYSLVCQLMGLPTPPNKAIVGTNAFAHSSGVHQDGLLKQRTTYEIMKPEDVGADTSLIVLTSRSGRAALNHRLEVVGFQLSREQLNIAYEEFLRLADKKKEVGDDDLRALAGMVLRGLSEYIILDVSTDIEDEFGIHQAVLKVKKGDEEFEWEGSAEDGPFDAIFHAIQKATGTNFELVEYSGHGVGKGSNAANMTVVRLKHNGKVSRGMGFDTDSAKAAAAAYLDAATRAQKHQGEDDFNPIRIGKPQELRATEQYSVPEPPPYGFLLVAVKGSEIAFAAIDSWKGGWKKSNSGWMYWNVREEVKYVSFPQFKQEEHSGRHIHGAPGFFSEDKQPLI